MFYLLITLTLFLLSKNPWMMIFALLSSSIWFCFFLTYSSSWLAYFLFLIYVGAMLVLFMYVISLLDNKPTSIKYYMMIPLILLYFYIDFIRLPQMSLKLSLLINPTNIPILLFIMIYLLIALLIVVKAIFFSKAPMQAPK
uniref:NADH dehydrogenase subunit 6 n=1 Tax=Acerentomon sp. JD-2012 TaxID=1258700 RepID=U3LGL7_9HEXA|nr:NADH dehydrogenase subunit 6 [Acerentomon sp. JD-2012]